MFAQLQLLAAGDGHHRQHPGSGIPVPELGLQGQAAPIAAGQPQLQRLLQPLAGGQCQQQRVAGTQPTMAQVRLQGTGALETGAVHRPAEAGLQCRRPRAGRGVDQPLQVGRLPLQGLLLDQDPLIRAQQQALVARLAGTEAATRLERLQPEFSTLGPEHKLPLLQLALPAIKTLSVEQAKEIILVNRLFFLEGTVLPLSVITEEVAAVFAENPALGGWSLGASVRSPTRP